MLKLMLVDDESVIRKGIRTSIDWEQYGIEVAAEAVNGADALEKALTLHPHIVITDIRMPVMDGIVLSEHLKTRLPSTRVVILSGYDDFAYAREALHLGVYEYLLKPVGAEELISLVCRLRDEILKEQAEKNKSLAAHIAFNENFPQIKSNFIGRLLKGEYTNVPAVLDRAKALKLSLNGPEYLVFALAVDDFLILTEDMPDRDIELLLFSVMNIAEELLAPVGGLVCYSEFEHLIGLCGAKNLTASLVDGLCKEIQYCIRKYLNLSVSIGIGKTYGSLLDMQKSYSEAITALHSRIYKGKNSIIMFNALDTIKKPEVILYPSEEEKEILGCLKSLNLDGIDSVLDTIFARFSASSAAPENIRNICCRLLVITISCIEEMGINIQNGLGAHHFNPYREVEKLDVLDDLHKWLRAFFLKALQLIQDNKTAKFKGIIKIALQYIEENYQKDLSLGDIAQVVFVTPNYLSRIFKEEMNINFVDWLNRFRVEKAKSFLAEPGAKTYEVAEKVGYGDYKYFSHVFKKFTGCTPKEFKEKQYQSQ